jgi:hypothetical protein
MNQDGLSEYSGVAGKVLRGSISFSSMITGFILGFIIMAMAFLLTVLNAPITMFLLFQFLFAMAISRFAVNGLFGEWSGTILSSAGGTWTQVMMVTLRYLTLTAIWMLPLVLIDLKVLKAAESMVGGIGMGIDMGMGPDMGMGMGPMVPTPPPDGAVHDDLDARLYTDTTTVPDSLGGGRWFWRDLLAGSLGETVPRPVK